MEQDYSESNPIGQDHLETSHEVLTGISLSEPIEIKTEIKEEFIIDGEIISSQMMYSREECDLQSGMNTIESDEEDIGIPCSLDTDGYQTDSDEESISSLEFEQTLLNSYPLDTSIEEEHQINDNETEENVQIEEGLVCGDQENNCFNNISELKSLPNSSQPVECCSESEEIVSHLEDVDAASEFDERMEDESVIVQELSSGVTLADNESQCRKSMNKSESSKDNFQCPYCFFITSLHRDIAKHLREEHKGRSVYSCPLCVRMFSTIKDFVKHSRQCRAVVRHCEKCNLDFSNDRDLKSHSCRSNLKIKLFCCSDCHYVCRTRSQMDLHIADLHKPAVLCCLRCNYETTDEIKLNSHFVDEHDFLVRQYKEGKKFVCMFCDYYTTSKIKFYKHYYRNGLLFCHFCDFSAEHCNFLVSHVSSTHQDKILNCQVCEFKTYVVKKYVTHLKTRHKKVEEMSCKQCSFTFKDIELFEKHLLYSHRKGFNCYFCSFKHFDKKMFQLHLSYKHNVTYCVLCALKFPGGVSLKTHELEFHGVEVSCSLCSFISYDVQSLNEHYFFKHNIGFSCDTCIFFTNSPQQFSTHKYNAHGIEFKFDASYFNSLTQPIFKMNNHDKRVFLCEFCDYLTSSRSSLEKHLFSFHKEKVLVCSHS